MLASWTLGGFRSIGDRTSLELGPLNVLVGANSAGKSSVLHSILMAAQTLGNPLVDRPALLNGPLVRLGLPLDVLHEGSDNVHVGFELTPHAEPDARPGLRTGDFGSVRIDAEFKPARGGMKFLSVTAAASPPGVDDRMTVTIDARPDAQLVDSFVESGLSRDEARRFVTGLDLYGVAGALPERAAVARLQQFLPADVLVVSNAYESEIEQLRWAFFEVPETTRLREPALSRPVLDLIAEYLRTEFGDESADKVPSDDTITASELASLLGRDRWRTVESLYATPWFQEHRKQLGFTGVVHSNQLPDPLRTAVDYSRRWFQDSVRHLGPLRAAPQPLYNLPEAASGTSVGRDGEYTAAVLNAYASRRVACPDPETHDVSQVPLRAAVNTWMTALGLLSSVTSEERGKLGFELKLSIEGVERNLDLTTVGVGVSQALPIVTLGLLAEPGALLLFEQPELHLHPDVQAALGDFFVALSASGRQLVVETHSEYLVTRLRRRAATDDDSKVPGLVRLFFFERKGGESEITRGRIAEDGSMPEWPRGFLDTAARELQAIARRTPPA